MKFDRICESLSVITQTKRFRYPKQIKLSEEFINSLSREIKRFTTIDESKELPVLNLEEKLLKAFRFHIKELCEKYGYSLKIKKILKKKV